jgi:ABC-type lipoprotein export system ATPase subunit
MDFRHGIMIIGEAGSGKTSCLHVKNPKTKKNPIILA